MYGEGLVLSFGKHEGKKMNECPSSYLRWLVDKLDEKKFQPVILAAEAEIGYRDKHDVHWED